jgi:MFS family permease
MCRKRESALQNRASHKLGLNNPFLSLRHPNFRSYFIGMCVSAIGTWMQNTAQPWLAYTLTKSALLLSLVSALQFVPVLLFSLFAGVLIDRLPKKKVLAVTQSCSMLITLSLAVLVWSGRIQYWHLLISATLLGLVNTLDMPLRHSFFVELVGHSDLMNAIALNSLVFNIARMLGPTIAGFVMGSLGIAACFFVNAASFGAVLISLFFIHPLSGRVARYERRGVFDSIREGLRYIRGHNGLLSTLFITAVVSTFAPNFSVTIPVFATQILGQGETGYGLLMSAMGAGALCAALLVAALSKNGPRRFNLFVVPVLTGAALIAVGFTNTFAAACVALAGAGFLFVSYISSANSSMQVQTDDRYRGRVMSVYTFISAGSTPIGNLFVGGMDSWLGARAGFLAGGAAILLLMIPIYIYLYRKWASL